MIGIIGQGVVGSAHSSWFMQAGLNLAVCDRQGKFGTSLPGSKGQIIKTYTCAKDLARFCVGSQDPHLYFLCLPTPMNLDGSANTDIVFGVLEDLNQYDPEAVKVIKSTVPPGSVARWNKRYNDRVVFCPEFLTEANPVRDLLATRYVILGGSQDARDQVERFFYEYFPNLIVWCTESTEAELVKYFINVHLAARVILSSEIAQVCTALGADYDWVKDLACEDQRIGYTHMNVPGPDGVIGARGHCFPKDLCALRAVARECGVQATVMDALWAKNLELVPKALRDWEQMKGRAVV